MTQQEILSGGIKLLHENQKQKEMLIDNLELLQILLMKQLDACLL